MRRYGVEMEFFGISQDQACTIVNKVSRCVINGYNHQTLPCWKIVPDRTVADYGGFELVSPILQGEQGLSEIKLIAKLLTEAGAKVNDSCGFHVHIDGSDFTGIDLVNVLKQYEQYEDEIDQLMVPSRRAQRNQYCRGLRNNNSIKTLINREHIFFSPKEAAQKIDVRYYKLNIRAFLRHGTVEFRHYAGTMDGDEMVHWVLFCLNFVEKSLLRLKPKYEFGEMDRTALRCLINKCDCGYSNHCLSSKLTLFTKLSRYLSSSQKIEEYLADLCERLNLSCEILLDETEAFHFYKLFNKNKEEITFQKFKEHIYLQQDFKNIFEGLSQNTVDYFNNQIKRLSEISSNNISSIGMSQ